MSSPLKAFRKHQKMLIVVFGVLLMVSFTVLASVQQYFQPKPPGQTESERVVVTWKGEDITRGNLVDLRVTASAAFQFLAALENAAQENGGSSQVKTQLDAEIAFALDQQLRKLIDEGFENVDPTDVQLVYQVILERKADEMGVVVNNDTITRYFAKVSDDSLRTPQQFEALFAREFRHSRVNYKGVLAFIRQMLLAQNVYNMGVSGLAPLSPGEAKAYHDRLYRRKRIELLPIKVEDYLSHVTRQPSSSELDQLYQQGKDKFATAEPSNVFQLERDRRGADPGFRQRNMIQLGYFKGDANVFRELEEAKITDAQIAAYYEENKDGNFRRSSFMSGETTDDAPIVKPLGLPQLDGADMPSKGANPATSSSGSGDEGAGETAIEPANNEKQLGDTPGEGVDTDPADDSTGESASSGDQSSLESRAYEPTVFVSLDDEAGTAEAPVDTVDDSTAEPNSSKNPNGEANPDNATGDSEENEPQSKYKSLSEVADQIRTILAKKAVVERYKDKDDQFDDEAPYQYLRDQQLDSVSRFLVSYARAHNRWTESQRQGNPGKRPKPLDWEMLAGDHNLTYGTTRLVDPFQLAETEVANAVKDQQFGEIFTDQLRQEVFQPQRKLYQASQFPPVSNEIRYLYWKVAEKEEQTPPKEKILNEIESAWRMQEARKLAIADAEKKAASVTDGKSLAEVFNEAVLTPGSFTWLSTDNMGRLNFSKVDGVDTPGERFHRDASNLKQGEVGIARNQPETVVYVVRVVNESSIKFEEVTRQITNLAQFDRVTALNDWLDDVAREMEVEWHAEPTEE